MMTNTTLSYRMIGILHTPFNDPADMPIQPTSRASRPGVAVIDADYTAGLKDLSGFSHIYLLYHFHRVSSVQLSVVPFLDRIARGVFATRAPTRPNPIGLSIVRLDHIAGNELHLLDVDMLDGTPLLDIKPYVPAFDERQDVRIGWLSANGADVTNTQSDRRFK